MADIEPAQFSDYSGPSSDSMSSLPSGRILPPRGLARDRPCRWNPKTAWTGDAFGYDLFHHLEHRWLGLRWTHGGGTGWLIEQDRTNSSVHSLLRHIAQLPDETMRWDFCHQLAESMARTAHAARIHESERWEQAFLKKQIAIRCRNGQRRANILSPTELADRAVRRP